MMLIIKDPGQCILMIPLQLGAFVHLGNLGYACSLELSHFDSTILIWL